MTGLEKARKVAEYLANGSNLGEAVRKAKTTTGTWYTYKDQIVLADQAATVGEEDEHEEFLSRLISSNLTSRDKVYIIKQVNI